MTSETGPQIDNRRQIIRSALLAAVLLSVALFAVPTTLVQAEGQAHTAIGVDPSYTMNRTLSDQAQENTIAFDGLAFLTGDLGADSFFPPGKVSDFFGFQYLRDNDPSQKGHSGEFLTRAANNMLSLLDDTQRNELVVLAKHQVSAINQYALDRFVLMDGFRRLLTGNMPEGSTGLNMSAVMSFSADLYELDGQMSIERAQLYGSILHSLNETQRTYLEALRGKGMLEWPNVDDQLKGTSLSQDENVAVMTYASDMFSWYLGSVDADVYFCPERQGTYFGSFYMKDAPAMGNPNYTIGEDVTGNSGMSFLNNLTSAQARLITDLVDIQRPYLQEIVQVRTNVSEQLRLYMSGDAPDTASVLKEMERYGELDGIISYNYANAFAQVNETLSDEQRAALASLRADLGVTVPSGAYLFSNPVAMPEIPNTDFLFTVTSTSNADQDNSVLYAALAIVIISVIVSVVLIWRKKLSKLDEGDSR